MGLKYDENKLDWDLLPDELLEEIVVVLMYGARKYAPNNWQLVEQRRRRYHNALRRHLTRFYRRKEMFDPQTGLLHAAQVAVNAIFLLYDELGQLAERERGGFQRPPVTLPDGSIMTIEP